MQAFERTDDDSPLTLVGIEFPDVYRAQEFLSAATRLAANGHLQLRDAVFVAADAEGKTVVRETRDPSPGRSALGGAMWAATAAVTAHCARQTRADLDDRKAPLSYPVEVGGAAPRESWVGC
jgi:hypothetical protein